MHNVVRLPRFRLQIFAVGVTNVSRSYPRLNFLPGRAISNLHFSRWHSQTVPHCVHNMRSACLFLGALACKRVLSRPGVAFVGCCHHRFRRSSSRSIFSAAPPPRGDRGVTTGTSRMAEPTNNHHPEHRLPCDPPAGTNISSAGRKRPAPEVLRDDRAAKKPRKNAPRRNKKEQRRKNRPGFNSYLKVLLDQSTMRMLQTTILDIRQKVQESNEKETGVEGGEERTSKEETAEETNVSSNQPQRNKSRPLLRIKPRSLESLHMTLFFGGETLCELSPEELTVWHEQVAKRIRQSFPPSSDGTTKKLLDFCQCCCGGDGSAATGNSETDDDNDDCYWFRLKEVCVFPPRRKNLIVATLEASPAWHTLHDDIRAIAAHSESSEGLRNLVESTSFEKWTPHITLANIIASGPRSVQRAQTKRLGEMLHQVELPESLQGMLKANAITMGGPVPQQVPLDWNFPAV